MKLRLLTVVLMLNLAGCSTVKSMGGSVSDTVGGWFGSKHWRAGFASPMTLFQAVFGCVGMAEC